MTDLCGVRWDAHGCRFDNDGHLVGVDCECHCENTGSGYPYLGVGHADFRLLSHWAYGEQAQLNYEHATRFGVGG